MQMVKKAVLFLLVFWFATLIFMPKKQLYYTLENELLKQDIVINEESIDEGIFSLNIKGAKVYAKGINIASVDEISIFTLLFYNSVNVKNILFDDSLKNFVPSKVDKTVAINSILSPSKVFITTLGTFGLAEGVVDLGTNNLRIDIVDEKDIKTIKSQLKKDEKGLYYETSF
ncbi:hypothetical protein MNB_SV-5-289 [hydrothermal vent metagenome]|uniref:Uncharacterized protein n=1 Tax=hydrothermal vent metagenome TaxID=652676 RepID=A0A1W1EBE8_9ZZZZ